MSEGAGDGVGIRRRAALSVSLTLGLAACSEGCSSQPVPVTDPSFAHQAMTPEQLDALLMPAGNGRWRAVPEYQLFAIEQLVPLLLDAAAGSGLSVGARRRAAKLAKASGLELHEIEIALDGRGPVDQLWVLVEPADDRRGRGAYVIRVGELAPIDGSEAEYLLQAPHIRYDKDTGTIALRLFLERSAELPSPRALFLSSVHRYAQADGSRRRNPIAEDNPADAAHREDHPLSRVTARALAERELVLVQLHGFGRKASSGDPDVIVSAGQDQPHLAAQALAERLRARLPDTAIGLFGVDTDRLGAKTNVQGQAARTAGRCFVHIETSEAVRDRLRDDRDARRDFAAAVFGAAARELSGGCS